jgi:hypothetical protein
MTDPTIMKMKKTAAYFHSIHGSLRVRRLSQPTRRRDGVLEVLCQQCFDVFEVKDLEPCSDGGWWDVCRACATKDKQHGGKY